MSENQTTAEQITLTLQYRRPAEVPEAQPQHWRDGGLIEYTPEEFDGDRREALKHEALWMLEEGFEIRLTSSGQGVPDEHDGRYFGNWTEPGGNLTVT
jgi:hypothetical protein